MLHDVQRLKSFWFETGKVEAVKEGGFNCKISSKSVFIIKNRLTFKLTKHGIWTTSLTLKPVIMVGMRSNWLLNFNFSLQKDWTPVKHRWREENSKTLIKSLVIIE